MLLRSSPLADGEGNKAGPRYIAALKARSSVVAGIFAALNVCVCVCVCVCARARARS